MDTPADIHFDAWTLRRHPRELLRDGVRVRLQEQPLRVLEELLAAPGEIVTREHLITQLWPKRIVEFETALNAAVRRLRATLGDEADTPRFIETIPRQGYRFIGAVRIWRDAPMAEATDPLAEQSTMPPPPPVPPASMERASRRLPHAGLAFAGATLVVGIGIAAAWVGHAPTQRAARADDVSVSEPMQRARYFAQRRHPGDLEKARGEYERALFLAPNHARAWAGLASVYWLEAAEGLQPAEATLPKVRDAAQRALALDPDLAEAHLRLAMFLSATGQRAAARD